MQKPKLDPQFKAYVAEQPRLTYSRDDDHKIKRLLINSLEVAFGRNKIEKIYRDLKKTPMDVSTFFQQAIDASEIDVCYHGLQPDELQVDGPLIFLANHPFGIVDGMVFCNLAARMRGDLRIMIHSRLCQDKDLVPYFLPIDFAPTKEAMKTNIRSKQLALECLSNNVPVLIFPSGMVSTAGKFGFGKVKDAQWTTFAAKIVKEAQATVVPVYFHGQNSRKFHVASHIAEPLRMGMLLHEAVNKFGRRLDVTIGRPLPWTELDVYKSRQDLTDALYNLVNSLR